MIESRNELEITELITWVFSLIILALGVSLVIAIPIYITTWIVSNEILAKAISIPITAFLAIIFSTFVIIHKEIEEKNEAINIINMRIFLIFVIFLSIFFVTFASIKYFDVKKVQSIAEAERQIRREQLRNMSDTSNCAAERARYHRGAGAAFRGESINNHDDFILSPQCR